MEKDLNLVKINSALREGLSHLSKIERARDLLKPYFPLTLTSFKELDDPIIEHIDQLVYRFTKLQDSMGRRLFPSLFYYLEPELDDIPFLDILNGLEKYGIIESTEKWQEFRIIRNSLAHDYPNAIGQTVTVLNQLYSDTIQFLELFNSAVNFVSKREDLKDTIPQ
jgi:hypothetical protein